MAEKNKQLLEAAKIGDEAAIERLLDDDEVNVETRDSTGYGLTPLIWAARNGHSSCVRLLLERGNAKIEARSDYKSTALLWAAFNGHVETVRVLLAHLNRAYTNGRRQDVVDAKDMTEMTSLIWAALGAHKDASYQPIVDLLLEAGADLHAKDHRGKTALALARENNQVAVVTSLEKWGAAY